MRVLWVCNIMLPVIAGTLGVGCSNKEGWLSGLSDRILAENASGITLGVCFPSRDAVCGKLPEKELYYYGFAEDTVHEELYDEALERRMKEIMKEFAPDIVHCFGTEYGHTLAAVRAFGRPRRTLIGLQGICGMCAEYFLEGVPENIVKRSTLRDFLKKDNMLRQQEKMRLRGEREAKALALTGHVTGRTAFDRKAARDMAPQAAYHFMNETMRAVFYEGCWDAGQCERHGIFISQGNYPLKGLHYMLRAAVILKKQYPDMHLYVAGDSIVKHATLKEKLKLSSYGKYLLSLIRDGGLEGQVTFLGQLNAKKMKEQYLKAGVFVSASAIENSPNSVGEAMLLGVPVVSSDVGGVPDLLTDQKEGLLYASGDVSALASAVGRIFEDRLLAESLSKAARERAHRTHNADANYARLMEIYHEMYLCQ